jgi:CheY-specific phosphatase CheX
MCEDHTDVLMDVFSEVAENLAFMFVDPPEEDEFPEPTGPCVRAEMGFVGPFTGTVSLAVPESLCPQIAANVLGLDPDDELVTAKPHDALKELLNVTCGNLLTRIAGDEPVFDLTVPEVISLDEESWQAYQENPKTVGLILEDEPIIIGLFI